MRRMVALVLVVVLASLSLTACGFVGARPASFTRTPGFFVGAWDGLIAPWTLVLRAFLDVRMYAVPNSGWWYDAGFLLGIAASLPLGWAAALVAVVQHVL